VSKIVSISIVIPAFNNQATLGMCLDGLLAQATGDVEIIVVDDGSTDTTRAIAESKGVRVLSQSNQGAAAARNAGARQATGEILMFIDGDCVPERNWIQAMLAPFANSEIVGACGMKQTQQSSFMPRFIQLEFDYRYENERKLPYIDFVDSGTAAYRREVFLQNGGFDTLLSDAEDTDLSYRLSARGYKMAFAGAAIVYDPHPESLFAYLKRKCEYAFWRTQVYARYPQKVASDSRTPQTQKLQGLLVGLGVCAALASVVWQPAMIALGVCAALFLLTTLPFIVRNFRRAPLLALVSPPVILLAAFAGMLGIALGMLKAKIR
jgi:glycosyltransferase involved in cell wall biosynthesis